MHPLKIERALALIDPMGLIKMGAPPDEYTPEAEKIHSLLKDDFTDRQFIKSFYRVMEENFGLVPKISSNQQTQLIDLIRDGNNGWQERFMIRELYRVVDFPIVRFEVDQHKFLSGDHVMCLHRFKTQSSKNSVIFLLKDKIIDTELGFLEETRMRWFFEKVIE